MIAYLAKVRLTSIDLVDGVGICNADDIRPDADCAPVLFMKLHDIHLMGASPRVDEAPEMGAFCSHWARYLSQAWAERRKMVGEDYGYDGRKFKLHQYMVAVIDVMFYQGQDS